MNEVFKKIKSLAEPLNSWDLNESIRRVEESYLMMLKYTIDGIEDPNREAVYADIVASIYRILDVITRETLRKEQSSSIYFSTLRFKEMQRGVTISQMLADYAEKCDQLSMFNLVVNGENETQSKREKELARIRNAQKIVVEIDMDTYFPYLADEPYVHYYDSLAIECDSLQIYRFKNIDIGDTIYRDLRMVILDSLAVKDSLMTGDTLMVTDTISK
jgi:hypothetical protein